MEILKQFLKPRPYCRPRPKLLQKKRDVTRKKEMKASPHELRCWHGTSLSASTFQAA